MADGIDPSGPVWRFAKAAVMLSRHWPDRMPNARRLCWRMRIRWSGRDNVITDKGVSPSHRGCVSMLSLLSSAGRLFFFFFDSCSVAFRFVLVRRVESEGDLGGWEQ